jgi:tetratricopeptide (TPR) repeat protein
MEKTSLAGQLCYLLNIDESIGLADYTAIAGTQESPTLVLIDGLNEAHNAESLWQELFEISKCFTPGSLKFVVSTRANNSSEVNRYSITAEQVNHLYGESMDNELQVSGYVHWLTALSMEEMKEAWDFYVNKDKGKFKPLFAFDDLATFDRSLYNELSNPLVLRLFLETYKGKGLPKKGTLHLDVWGDWLASFSEQEQHFFNNLAEAIWEKGENELLLDDVLNDDRLKGYFTTDQLNAPYPRLRNLGWISRYVKDLNTCVGLTVEGALLYLLGKKFINQQPSIELAVVKDLLKSGSKVQKAGVGNYLEQLALRGDLGLVCELIDLGDEFIDVCTTPIVMHLKTSGVKETLDILLQNPTENDWLVLLKVDEALEELTLHPLRREMAMCVLSSSDFSSKAAVQYGLKGIPLVDRKEGEGFLSVIEQSGIQYEDDAELSNSLGVLFAHFADYDKALTLFQECLSGRLKLLEADHPDLSTSYNNIGAVWYQKAEYDKALEFYNQCLQIRIKTLGTEHPWLAESYNDIGLVWSEKGEYDKALEFYQQSLDILLKTLGAEHPSVAESYNNIGADCYRKGEYNKALEFFLCCLNIELKTLGTEHPSVSTSYNNIGTIYRNIGEYDNALGFHQKSLDIRLKTMGEGHPSVAFSYNNIGTVLRTKGEYDKALEFYQRGLYIRLNIFGTEHPDVADSYNNIGLIWYKKVSYDKALDFYQQCLKIQLKSLGMEHPDVASTYHNIGNVWNSRGDYDKALEFYMQCLSIRQKTLGAEHPEVASTFNSIGIAWKNKGEFDKALEFYQQCLDIQLKSLGSKQPDVASTKRNIEEVFKLIGD